MADILLIIGILLSRDTSYHILASLTAEKFMDKHGLRWLWAYLVGADDEEIQSGRLVAAAIISTIYLYAYYLDFWVLTFWVTCAVVTSIYWQLQYKRWSKQLDAALKGDEDAREFLKDEMGMHIFPAGVSEEHVDEYLELLEKEMKKHFGEDDD